MEFERLVDLIAETLNMNPEDITPDASFVNDLGADSLDLFQLVLKIEEEFGVEIPVGEAESLITVSDVEALLKRQ